MTSDSVSMGKEGAETVATMAPFDSVSTSAGEEEVDLCITHKLFDEVCMLGGVLDWISELPDELVINIVSRLTTLREAVRTSVLSRRWINLWKSTILVLDFDGSEELRDICKLDWIPVRILQEKRRWYKNWVNGVISQVQQQSCSPISKLSLLFNLTNNCNSEGDIDRWIKFAISKRVESLHLAFHLGKRLSSNYFFSEECYSHMKTPARMHDIRFLRSLRLNYVDVRHEIIEHFIANCPLLEELAVKWSRRLTRLKVVGSSLKHLEVIDCLPLESVEIDHAPRLERLILDDSSYHVEEIQVGNFPSLVDMSLGHNFNAEQGNLERLTVLVSAGNHRSILGLIPLINLCPRLHTLRLLLRTHYCTAEPDRQSVDVVKLQRESIKVVEVIGFRGYELEYEFMEYVMEYFVGLERIVIDWSTTSFFYENRSIPHEVRFRGCSKRGRRKIKKLILELKSRAAPTVEFTVI